MKSKFLLAIAVVLLCFTYTDNIDAQTHAHSTSRQWHGIDVATILANWDAVVANPSNYGVQYVEGKGIPVYLYNVGTGKFVTDGGDWGMEARLFYEDFGRLMYLTKESEQLRFNPDITEKATDKCRLTCNVPNVTRDMNWINHYDAAGTGGFSITTILDGYKQYANWYFERVETDNTSGYYTFNMYQKYSNPKNSTYLGQTAKNLKFYYGAAYGEWCSDGTTKFLDGSANKKGCGFYVYIDADRSCWTTAGSGTQNSSSAVHTFDDANGIDCSQLPTTYTKKVDVDGDMIPINELYQWRVIPKHEFLAVLNETEVVGLNPSISSLVPDRDFTRNSEDFFPNWSVRSSATGDNGRYRYTWGNYKKGVNQNKPASPDTRYVSDEAWDAPVMLKKVFGQIKNSKLGFMSFEGTGTVHVSVEVPHGGWYKVEASAVHFDKSNGSHEAFMYAQAQNADIDALSDNPARAYQGYEKIALEKFTKETDLFALYDDISATGNKSNEALNTAVGQVLTYYGDQHRRDIWVYVNPTTYDDTTNPYSKILTIGFLKTASTKSGAQTSEGNSYYYDQDWIAVDDIKVSYMGLAPAFFYEDEENMDYLVFDENKISERPSAVQGGMYSGSLSLERTFTIGSWNSFSFPIALTGEQVRSAFGEKSKLLELHSIGGLSQNANIIDFQTVELKPENPLQVVVAPGKFYLLKPTEEPVIGRDPLCRDRKIYYLGRNYFTVNTEYANPNHTDYAKYTGRVIDTETPYANSALQSWNGSETVTGGDNDGMAYVTYIQTPGYSSWSVNSGTGIYNGTDANAGQYAPKGAYVMAGGKMYELNKDTRIKGFRGWITLTHSLFENIDSGSEVKMSIDGIVDGDVDFTGIAGDAIPVPVATNTTVYDLCGRRVGTVGTASLPRGIYIVAGKKVFVK